MRPVTAILFLLLIPGCLVQDGGGPGDSLGVAAEPLAPLAWEGMLEDETLLLKIVVEERLNLSMMIVEDPGPPWFASMSVVGGHVSIHSRLGSTLGVHYNEFSATVPGSVFGINVDPLLIERSLDPGEWYVVLDSKNVATAFTLESASGQMEVVSRDPDMVRYRHSNDGEWDDGLSLHLWFLLHHDMRTTIGMKHSYLEVFFHTFASDWEIEVAPGCLMDRSYGNSFGVQAGEPLDVHAWLSGGPFGAWSLWMVVLDLPIEPPAKPSCRW